MCIYKSLTKTKLTKMNITPLILVTLYISYVLNTTEPEKVWQHCSNAAWKVNDLGGMLFYINLFRSSKYKSIFTTPK